MFFSEREKENYAILSLMKIFCDVSEYECIATFAKTVIQFITLVLIFTNLSEI